MSQALTHDGNLDTADRFLRAYWRADLGAAMAVCSADAVIELARSLPIKTPAPVGDILPLIFRDVYPRFRGGRFDVTVDSTMGQGGRVLVEYTARGTLTSGTAFECGYAAVLSIRSGLIHHVRMYTDTRYVTSALMT